ncbi:MAG: STAS domain-containing protein [Firmicutes bacterium]|nr:STAS domain-containing protein [Bacillota bacterium]
MNIEKTIDNGSATFALKGRLDAVTSDELEKELKDALEGLTDLTLDMEGLEYLSSAGLRVLLSVQKVMNVQGEIKLVHVSEPIMEIFEVTGFTDILNIL